jgi:NAD(P)H-hydrate epimerase
MNPPKNFAMSPFHPILTCAETRALENRLLGDDPEQSWEAMRRAGAGVGAAVLRDFPTWRPLPRDPRVLVLAGPGHNGGDALLAAALLLRARPRGKITVALLEAAEKSKPLTRRALDELLALGAATPLSAAELPARLRAGESWDITLDGLYGMSFRPPLREPARGLITALNAATGLGFRAAVDVPSGIGDEPADLAFRADFTYATGVVKAPLFAAGNAPWVGRVREVDIGFFAEAYDGPRAHPEDFLRPAVLAPLQGLRPSVGDKRTYGHLLVVSGSRAYPGAQMLNVLGALRAGTGLVTALVPAGHAGAFAAARPEAMWRACAEEADGGHGGATLAAARELWPRATAVLAGSGLGRTGHAQAMLQALVAECPLPLVLDADALFPATLAALAHRPAGAGPVVLTPHAGEFARLAGARADLGKFCRDHGVVTILKGPVTRVADGKRVWCGTFGGPVLARGGSGDVLAGIAGGLLAQTPADAFGAAARAAAWHGLAADELARARGETAALTAELASFMPEALRDEIVRD